MFVINQYKVVLKIIFCLFAALVVGDYIQNNPNGEINAGIVAFLGIVPFCGASVLILVFIGIYCLYKKIHGPEKDLFDSLPPEEAARLNALIDETVQKISLEMEAEEQAKKQFKQELAQKKDEK